MQFSTVGWKDKSVVEEQMIKCQMTKGVLYLLLFTDWEFNALLQMCTPQLDECCIC